ncbi:MAG: hypothetical protein KDA51_11215, partial [Planctomycetales bacterium]|nr:hypothetical protein [Planctomycetales bacterium]
RLFESRPWQTLQPNPSIVVAGQGSGEDHIQAARASDGKFLVVYVPRGNNLTIDMTKIDASHATAYWFNPHDGKSNEIGKFLVSGTRDFSPPSRGVDNDWVLVLDDASQDFPPPGVPAT